MYTEDNIKLLGTEQRWITRAPATLDEIKQLLNAELDFIPGTDSRYAFYAADLNYGGIPQRAVVVWSEEKQKRDEETFDRKIQKETAQAEKELKKIMSKRFACIPDAENEARIWASAHPYHFSASMGQSQATRLGQIVLPLAALWALLPAGSLSSTCKGPEIKNLGAFTDILGSA